MIRLRNLATAGACSVLLSTVAAMAADKATPEETSPSIVAQTHQPMPPNVDVLDAALKSGDYATINRLHGAITSGDELLLFMNWEQVRSFDGGGFFVTYIYMVDLWNAASSMPSGTPEQANEVDQLKQSAVFVALFTYELIVLDGTKCSDSTAVSHRVDQLMSSPAWSYVDQIPDDMRHKILQYLPLLEKSSADKRTNDTALCTGGMSQMIAGLAAMAESGKAPQEVPNAPGMIGKTYVVPPAPTTNLFVDQSVWQPQQAKLRESLPDRLRSLLKLPKEPAK